MTTTTRNNKKIAAGIAAAAAAVLAIGAGTFAFFDDTEAGGTATATAGTLDLEPGASNSAVLLDGTNIAPGFTSAPVTLSYSNAGTLPGDFALDFTITGTENGCNEPEDAAEAGDGCDVDSELLEKLLVSVNGATAAPVGDLADIAVELAAANAGDTDTVSYEFVFSLPGTTGNEVQSDTISVTSEATLDQIVETVTQP